MTLLAVTDVETTGEDPSQHLVCEVAFAWVDVGAGGSSRVVGQASSLCRVRTPIDVRARAVHHIHPPLLARARPAPTVLTHLWRPGAAALGAHMAAFDVGFLAPQAALARLALPPAICTYRVALHLWPDAPSHSLQALRYHLELRVRPPGWAHPHRALHDVLVAAELLRLQLRGRSVEELLHLTTEPVLQRLIKFGQHKGLEWRAVPGGYLRWMRREWERDPAAFDLDARYTCQAELARRAVPRTAVQPAEEAADVANKQRQTGVNPGIAPGELGTAEPHAAPHPPGSPTAFVAGEQT